MCTPALQTIAPLLGPSNFGAIVADCSLPTARSGNVWWEMLRGMVLFFQRPAHLRLAEVLLLAAAGICSDGTRKN